MQFNFQTICHSNLLKELPQRQRDVLSRRFGLKGEKETLESIGRAYNITRERVRQIERDGLKGVYKKIENPVCQKVFNSLVEKLKKNSNLKKEDELLEELGGTKFKNHIYFLLTLAKPFKRFNETEDFYAFWTIDKNAFNAAQARINAFIGELKKKQKPLSLPANTPLSYIEISKNILKGPEGLYGLRDWPIIRPRGIKDKAYIVLKKEEKPLHFTRVASLVNNSPLLNSSKDAVLQTVHNELIKDPRFVLIGRGLYALQEWGFFPGVVREVIGQVLKEAKKPLSKEQILQKVLKHRQVKANTVLLNLQNKKYFIKNSQGKYFIRKV